MASVLGNGKIRKDQTDHYGRVIGGGGGGDITDLAKNPVLGLSTNTDGDPIINLEYTKMEDGEEVTVNSPVAFDKKWFNNDNNHVGLNLYNCEITKKQDGQHVSYASILSTNNFSNITELHAWLTNNGFNSFNNFYPASGIVQIDDSGNNVSYPVFGVYVFTGTAVAIACHVGNAISYDNLLISSSAVKLVSVKLL